MADILSTVYALVVLVVAVGGMLAVVFGTPDVSEESDRRYQVLAVLAALFLVALVVQFLFGALGYAT